MGHIHITGRLFMEPDITIDHGTEPIIIPGQLLTASGFITIHGLDGDFLMGSVLVGSASHFIPVVIMAGGAREDIGTDTGMDIIMVTDMGIIEVMHMVMQLVEEQVTVPVTILKGPIICLQMPTKIEQLALKIPELDPEPERLKGHQQLPGHQTGLRNRQQEQGRRPNLPNLRMQPDLQPVLRQMLPEQSRQIDQTMSTQIKVVISTAKTIQETGNSGLVVPGRTQVINQFPVQ